MYPKLSEDFYWEYTKPNPDKDKGYYYYIQSDELDYHITPEGVSISREDGSCITFDFKPIDTFGKKDQLTEDQLFFILSLPVRGETHSKEEMCKFYNEFLSENN
jgi:hypothetical protein